MRRDDSGNIKLKIILKVEREHETAEQFIIKTGHVRLRPNIHLNLEEEIFAAKANGEGFTFIRSSRYIDRDKDTFRLSPLVQKSLVTTK